MRKSREFPSRREIVRRCNMMYRTNAMRKLGPRNQTDLIRYALRHDILPMDD